jgi:cell division protein FtsX
MTDLSSIDGSKGKPAATDAQMGAIVFKGVERLARMSREDREQKIRDLANSVYQAALIAMHVVTEDKDDLVAQVAANYETIEPMLETVFSGSEDAKTLFELVSCAEARWHVVLAAVHSGNPPDDDGGGEEAAA